MKGNKLKPKSLNLNPFSCQPDPFEPENWAQNCVEPSADGGCYSWSLAAAV